MATTDSDTVTQRTQPESFRARSLSASLTVKDVHASLAWYRDALGFTVGQRYEHEGELRAVGLVAGDVRLMVNQDDGAKGWDRTKGEGFSLYLDTVQDVDALAAAAQRAGATLTAEPADMPWGVRAFSVVDPDGFKLTVARRL